MSGPSRFFKDPQSLGPDPALGGLLKLNRPGEKREGGADTVVGRVALEAPRGLAGEYELLRAERQRGRVVLELDPKQIGATRYANRDARALNEDDPEFTQLKASLLADGQDQAICVRPLEPASAGGHRFEIVSGHRRHAAALQLDRELPDGFRILAVLDAAASDVRHLVLKMHRENEHRKELSAYEKGRSFLRWLEDGLFRTQAEVAESIGSSEPTVFKCVQIAQLPAEVLAAFADPREISLRWGPELARALNERGALVRAAAAEIGKLAPRPPADAVLKLLVAARPAGVEGRSRTSREEAVKIAGKVAFRMARRDGRVTLKFGDLVNRSLQKELSEEIRELSERFLKKHLQGRDR